MNYDSFATTFSNSRKNLSWPELDTIIRDMRKHGVKSVLDIGCGNGRFLEQCEMHEWEISNYLGIDNSLGMIEEARKLHPWYDFRVVPMESLGSEGPELGTYDALLFLASFHHLETEWERIETLKTAKTLLSPGGRIYMTNWNLRDQERYDSMKTSEGEYDIKIWAHSRYYHGFTQDELWELFRKSGYTILENRVFDGWRNLFSILGS